MGKLIYLSIEKKREILALNWNVGGVSRRVSMVTLQAALTYKTKTALANTLRAAAMQRGGVVYCSDEAPANYIPECYLTADYKNGIMQCVFGGCVVLTWNEDEQAAKLATPKKSQVFDNITTIADLMGLQKVAEKWAKSKY